MNKAPKSNWASTVPEGSSAGTAVLAAINETKIQAWPRRARLDITATARRCASLEVPTALTAALWDRIADGRPFAPEDERVRELCAPLKFAFTHLLSREDFEAGGESMNCRFELRGKPCAITVVLSPVGQGQRACTIMLAREYCPSGGRSRS